MEWSPLVFSCASFVRLISYQVLITPVMLFLALILVALVVDVAVSVPSNVCFGRLTSGISRQVPFGTPFEDTLTINSYPGHSASLSGILNLGPGGWIFELTGKEKEGDKWSKIGRYSPKEKKTFEINEKPLAKYLYLKIKITNTVDDPSSEFTVLKSFCVEWKPTKDGL